MFLVKPKFSVYLRIYEIKRHINQFVTKKALFQYAHQTKVNIPLISIQDCYLQPPGDAHLLCRRIISEIALGCGRKRCLELPRSFFDDIVQDELMRACS